MTTFLAFFQRRFLSYINTACSRISAQDGLNERKSEQRYTKAFTDDRKGNWQYDDLSSQNEPSPRHVVYENIRHTTANIHLRFILLRTALRIDGI